MAKMKKKAGEINSSSMADIAFLLLIFFLVTTTMDVDMGMRRTLPPLAEDEEQQPEDIKLKERNVLIVNVSKSGKIMVGDQIYDRGDLVRNGGESKLSKETFNFLVDPDRSEKKKTLIESNIEYDLSVGVVSLKADNETTFDVYMQVQDELTHAFNQYRSYVSEKVYGKTFDELDADQQNNLRTKLPPKISEAEPNDQTNK
ncbi:MAG: biopolymer transporter ExbD [Alistipes sp.]|nr:biopolymer transporter ExbD [Alistipes sp.]